MKLTPKIALSDDFLKSFSLVPRSHQQAVLNFVAKFRQNPLATGINYERIHDAADPNMRSVRVSENMRGIVLKPDVGNVYCLLWVAQHDDAYQWAKRHKVAVHPDIGSIQIFSVEEVTPAKHSITDADQPAGLFAGLKDREIRRLGVPDEMLPLVRAVTNETELDALQSRLPDEAYEALFMYAAGDSLEQILLEATVQQEPINPDDFSTALDRDISRRHFVVLTDDSDIEALLGAPLERWRIFLHPSQRKLVEQNWNGPVKVTGGAGTGKTVVAMHRAAKLAKQYIDLPGRPVVFTTFTKTLVKDIQQHLALLCSPQELEKIQVINLDQWASSLLRRFGHETNLLYNEHNRQQYWNAAMSVLPNDVDLSLPFLRAEFERVVLPQACETAEDYMRASRIGRGGQLSRQMRKAIWPVFAEYRAQLQAARCKEPEEAFREAAQLLAGSTESLGIRAMIVDEAQDISSAAFELIRVAVPQAENDLFIVGDAHQRIYRHKVVLSRAGIEVRGRSKSLKVNYRTTDEVRRWACAQLEQCHIDDLDGNQDSLRGYKSLTHGDMPDILQSASIQDDVMHISNILEELTADGIDPRQVCITARTNDDLDAIATALKQANVAIHKLDAKTADDDNVAGVRLSTMHRVKGLEFNVIIIAAYKGAKNYAALYSHDEDAGVAEETEIAERCLLHVAATRAKQHLFVLTRDQDIK